MKISSRFSIAIHTIALIHHEGGKPVPSNLIAGSVNTNPVIIRRILGMLKNAGFVKIERGPKGATLIKSPNEITLLDIYKAVDSLPDGELFQMHEHPNPACEVGANIQSVIEIILLQAQDAMEKVLESLTVEDVIDDLALKIAKSKEENDK